MNYLGHCLLADGGSPEFRFGSMAPDFVSMSEARLRRVFLPEKRQYLSSPALDIQQGIDFHLRVDKKFDDLGLLKGIKKHFRDVIAGEHFSDDQINYRIAADMGTDILLDGAIMKRWPEVCGEYFEAMAFTEDKDIAVLSTNPERTIECVRIFETKIPDYSDVEVVARTIFNRLKGRPRLSIAKVAVDALSAALNEYKPRVESACEELINQTARELLIPARAA